MQYLTLRNIIMPLLKGGLVGLVLGITHYRLLRQLEIKTFRIIITNLLVWSLVFYATNNWADPTPARFWIINGLLLIVISAAYSHLLRHTVRAPFWWGLGAAGGFLFLHLQTFLLQRT